MVTTSIAQARSIGPGQLFINGKWQDAEDGSTKPTINPVTEQETAQIAQATEADVNAAVTAARKASGYGRECGPEAMEYYTQTKSVWIDLS